jgi:hypothetical protein
MSAADVVRSHPSGCILTVWVVPGAGRTEIVGYHAGALRVRVTAPAEKGKANEAVITLLERDVGCRLQLAAGAGSRRKRLLAVGVDRGDLIGRLEELGI